MLAAEGLTRAATTSVAGQEFHRRGKLLPIRDRRDQADDHHHDQEREPVLVRDAAPRVLPSPTSLSTASTPPACKKAKSVTHVSGTKCHLCLGPRRAHAVWKRPSGCSIGLSA